METHEFDDREHIMDEMYLYEKTMEDLYEWEEEYNRSLQEPAQIKIGVPNETFANQIP